MYTYITGQHDHSVVIFLGYNVALVGSLEPAAAMYVSADFVSK